METYSEVEPGGVTTTVTEKSASKKMNFKNEKEKIHKILNSEISKDLLKYLPTRPKQNICKKYINTVSFNKFD